MRASMMAQPAEDMIMQNLIEAVERLREDLNKVELWAAALDSFKTPAPPYQPGDQYLLPPLPRVPPHREL